MDARKKQRLAIVAVAIVLLVALSTVASWQLAALGVGFVAIGVILLMQSRRNRTSG